MNFSLTDQQLALQETARRFAREEIAPIASEHDHGVEPFIELRRQLEGDFVFLEGHRSAVELERSAQVGGRHEVVGLPELESGGGLAALHRVALPLRVVGEVDGCTTRTGVTGVAHEFAREAPQ